MNDDDKRHKKRINYSYSVLCFKKFDNYLQSEIPFITRIEVFDISYGGLGVITEKKVEIGDILMFNIVLHDTERMAFKAKVKWKKHESFEYKAGLEFIDLRHEDVMFLHDLLMSEKVKRSGSR